MYSSIALSVAQRIEAVSKAFGKAESANVAIICALTLPAMLTVFGLSADVGYWFFRQRVLQGAADIGAYNGTVMLRGGAVASAIRSSAHTYAAENGWVSNQGTITVHTPPTSGEFQDNQSVEVILTETQPRFFSKIFTDEPLEVSVRAVARYNDTGLACLLALNKTKGKALEFWGNNETELVGCNIMSNSMADDGIGIGGSSKVTVPCAMSVGGVDVSATLKSTDCSGPITKAIPAKDPYANLTPPPVPKSCNDKVPKVGALSAGCYSGGMDIKDTRNLSPGTYIIKGGTFTLNAGANITGNGVTFYLTDGATLKFNGGAHMDLNAPTTGTYGGILFYGDRDQAYDTNLINGDSTSSLTGAVYFPTQEVKMNGNFSGDNGCMQIVADTISVSGSTQLSASCAGTGLAGVPLPGAIAMVE